MMYYQNDFPVILKSNEVDISQIENKYIYLTGATGLIGSAFLELIYFLNKTYAANIKVTLGVRDLNIASHRFKDFSQAITLRYEYFDLAETKPVSSDSKYDFVVHAASIANPKWYKEKPFETILYNSVSVERMLSFASAVKARLLFLSSVEVYGDTSGIKSVDEKTFGFLDPSVTQNSYAESKRYSEALCVAKAHQHKQDVVIVRPSKVYGPSTHTDDDRLMAHILKASILQEDVELRSGCEEVFTFCYAADAAVGVLIALLKGKSGEAYNIADKNSVARLRDVVAMQAKIAGITAKFGEETGSAVSKDLVVSAAKLEHLGWSPEYNLERGLQAQFAVAMKQKDN